MCVVSTSFILPKIFLKTRILNSFKDLVFVEFNFVDFNTIPIRLAVLFVTFFVVIFSSYYIKEDKILVYFLFMVLAFVVSILILSVANSLFLIFIG
jgi:NADH:ubiquinone oxidoreductase subunit 5 (subunit L)/multisubunit Na+/H+ antiporter MnhA subunit